MTIRIVQFGLGSIGSAMAKYVVESPALELVGGVDIDPDKQGRDVGEVIGLENSLGVAVGSTLEQSLAGISADVVLHTTSSYFSDFEGQIIEILEAGLDIVSTSEELSFPWLAHAKEASRIDAAAKRVGKTVLGTGINPGFLMDTLPLALTALSQKVEGVEVKRVIDASTRRGPFQAKIGSGMSISQFNSKVEAGRMGHVGLSESVGMIFHTLGKSLDRYESSVEPVVAEEPINTEYFSVQPGQVKGLKQVACGYSEQEEFVRLTFVAALEAANEGDTLVIKGKPELTARLTGTNGDLGTVAITANATTRVLEAQPGLVTMNNLPIVTSG